MGKYDFTGLMDEPVELDKISIQKKQSDGRYDFTGLMDEPIADETEKPKKGFKGRSVETQANIENIIGDRGSVWNQFTPNTSIGGRAMTGLTAIGVPGQLLQSGIANPLIELQKGNVNPIDLAKKSFEGFIGKRRGEFGDVGRMAGAPEAVSATLGLAADIAIPMGLAKVASKLGAVSKFADAKTTKAIRSFVKSVEGNKGALVKVGSKVQNYYDDIGKVVVDKTKFLDEMSNATNAVKKSISDIPGATIKQAEKTISELAEDGTVNAVRKAKDMVDDLITQWNKSATGGKVSKTQKHLMAIRGKLDDIASDAIVVSKTKQVGAKKAAKYLKGFKKTRKDYSIIKKGYSDIQKRMVNPNTGEPTKTGDLLKNILDSREGDLRKTLAAISKKGVKGNKFAQELKSIEKSIRLREGIGKVGQGVAYGLGVGTAIRTLVPKRDFETVEEKKR